MEFRGLNANKPTVGHYADMSVYPPSVPVHGVNQPAHCAVMETEVGVLSGRQDPAETGSLSCYVPGHLLKIYQNSSHFLNEKNILILSATII